MHVDVAMQTLACVKGYGFTAIAISDEFRICSHAIFQGIYNFILISYGSIHLEKYLKTSK